MIEYALQDVDGNQFNLNDSMKNNPAKGSLTFNSDSFSYDTNIVENTFLPGSVKIGNARLQNRSIEFTLNRAEPNSDDYKQYVNELLQALSTVVYLIDVTNDRRIKVITESISINFDDGSLYHSGNEGFVLNCLNPYWEDNTEQTVSQSILANDSFQLAFNNDGYLEIFSSFRFTVTVATTLVRITIGNQTISVQDSLFGTTGFEVMVINNDAGVTLVGNLNRTKSITEGTGFISIPTGAQEIELFSNQNADVTITYRRRYYV